MLRLATITAAVFLSSAAALGASQTPCLELEVHHEGYLGDVFRIALFDDGRLFGGYVGSLSATAQSDAGRVRQTCQAISAAIPLRYGAPYFPADDSQLGGIDYLVVRAQGGKTVAFWMIGPGAIKVSESELGRLLCGLDHLLRDRLPHLYCTDDKCKYTQLGWFGGDCSSLAEGAATDP